jgi:Na+-driven multidrug efflux pump
MQIDGVWLSLVVAELLAGIVAIAFVLANKRKYHY